MRLNRNTRTHLRPPIRRSARISSMALAAILALTLTACQQGIPSEGGVNVGLTDLNSTDQSVIFTPSGPTDGATPEAIIRGFTSAASSATDDYAIARSFLTKGFAREWNAKTRVVIDEKARTATAVGESVMQLTVAPSATLSDTGELLLSAPGTNETFEYTLEQVGGEWRISSAPDGILLDRATFSLVFNQHTLYFVEPQRQTLVPDPRWFRVGTTAATDVVTELLSGPSARLTGGVVTSAFPEGTALAADSVPVIDGVASIDLNPEAASVDADTLKLMKQQLGASLQTVTGVNQAALTVEQTLFAQTDVIRGAEINFPQVNPKPVIQIGAELGELNGVTLLSLGFWVRAVTAADPSDVTIRSTNDAAIMLSSAGLSWVNDQSAVTLLDGRSQLASPTLDRSDFVYSTQRTSPQQIQISQPGTAPSQLNSPWAEVDEVKALRVSRDGTRLAALVKRNGAWSVRVSGVIRDESGKPAALTPAATVAWVSGEAVDLDWMNASQLALATQPTTGNVRITGIGLGIFETEGGTSPDIRTISGANARAELTAISAEGVILAPQGVTWKQVVNNITLLAKRG